MRLRNNGDKDGLCRRYRRPDLMNRQTNSDFIVFPDPVHRKCQRPAHCVRLDLSECLVLRQTHAPAFRVLRLLLPGGSSSTA